MSRIGVKKKNPRRRKTTPEIPVNSFADIAFLLIIFFIVASTLTRVSGVVTDIPSGEKSEAKEEKTAIVQIKNQQLLLNEVEVTPAVLREKLAAMDLPRQHEEARIILLEAVGDVAYQDYYTAMTAISGAGGVVAIIKEGDGE